MFNSFLEQVSQKYKICADDEAIKPNTKPGKLDPNEDWTINRIEYLEGPFGEPEYDRCEHCGKTIRYVVNLTTPDLTPEAKVGPDCALALLKNPEDVKSVQEFVGNYQKKYKFIANITAYLQKEAAVSTEQDDFLDYLAKAQRNPQFKNLWGSWDTVTYQTLALGKDTAKRLSSFAQVSKAQGVFKVFSTRMLLRAVLKKKPAELRACLEKVFLELKLTARDKKYFFDAKESSGPVSEFLADCKDQLLDNIGDEKLTINTTFLVPPEA